MGRLPLIACTLCGVLVAVVVLHTRGALGDSAPSPQPVHEVYAGRTDDGGRIRLERWDDAYAWRVDSPTTSHCAPRRYRLGAGWAKNDQQLLATDGSFADNGGYPAYWESPGGRRLDVDVRFSLVGKVDDGHATGRYQRSDRLYRNGRLLSDCVRRTSFDVPRG
jgi:hypothetical protein